MVERETVGTRESPEVQPKEGRGHPAAQLAGVDPKEAIENIASLAREHPHAALTIAAAIGFVLGGGLSPRILGFGIGILARGYGRQVIEDNLQDLLRRG